MNDADRKIVERFKSLASHPDCDELIHVDHADPLLDLIESQAVEIERLRDAGHQLEHALEAIDIALMPADQRKADTMIVGGPLSPYGFDSNEQGVVERVRAFVETHALSARDRRFLANYLRIPKEEQCDD